jgi:hypothetical protein
MPGLTSLASLLRSLDESIHFHDSVAASDCHDQSAFGGRITFLCVFFRGPGLQQNSG